MVARVGPAAGDAASHMQAYSAASSRAWRSVINVYKTGLVTAQLFFGTWLFPLGYLVYRSGFCPGSWASC